MRRSIRKVIMVVLLAAGVWLAVLGLTIWRFGAVDRAQKADCAIVLGAAIRGGRPTPVFEERIRHAVNLYQQRTVSKVVLTGGFGKGVNYSESQVGAIYAGQLGVLPGDILTEEKSKTTRQNLVEAGRVMKQNGLDSAVLVSDPLHMKRALMMAEDLGIRAYSSPTPTSRYRSPRTRAGFLLRELYFYHHYLVFGQ